MPTYPLDTEAATITSAGITAPSQNDILLSLVARARAIFGDDIYLDPDSQDGQLLGIISQAISDANDAVIAAYAHMSPATAIGEGLSSVCRINGVRRAPASNSQVSLFLTGAVGTVIRDGEARDTLGQIWLLPSPVTIPGGGSITVTALAKDLGDLRAEPGTVTKINTPTAGWTSVTNATAATPGEPVESDAALRLRQADSVALPARSLLSAIRANILAVDGVTHARVYENATGSTDTNGVTAWSLAPVVAGGDAAEVALAIMNTKPPGIRLFGSTTVNLVDEVGETQAIKFTVPASVTVNCQINLTGLVGYTTSVGDEIKAAIVEHINALAPGEQVYWSRLFKPALLIGSSSSNTYEINTLQIRRGVDAFAQSDVAIGPFELARIAVGNITITAV